MLCHSGDFRYNLYSIHLGPVYIVGRAPHFCQVERMEAGNGQVEVTIESPHPVEFLN